jgi:hypothetical protein
VDAVCAFVRDRFPDLPDDERAELESVIVTRRPPRGSRPQLAWINTDREDAGFAPIDSAARHR